MTTNSSLLSGIHKEKQILSEVGNSEKQLWALIHSKGLLNSEGQDLYRNIRSSYERTILNNHTHSELQDVEYSLWKLHYKHIDEFRKMIKKCSGNAENNISGIQQNGVMQINKDNHIKAFKSFLSEATEFYQTLVVGLKKYYGVTEEALFYKKGCVPISFEPESTLKCLYLCHRCLVCMGDLARYKQQYENLDIHSQNWSVAATHYLEATRIWPDSGNAQNQLAVLATYTGDDFLALYHCVRSIAVKEPFPDAWDNLILLLEKNRSANLQHVSSDVCFDFSKPSQRISKETKERPNDNSSNCNMFDGESNHFTDTKLWSLIVKTISFLFKTSSLEEFPIALASLIGVLDEMMELEDTKLMTILESYGQMDLARKGPFRALQVVSILIFTLKNLIDEHQKNESKYKDDCQQFALIPLAIATAFIFMGRFVERCLKSSPLNYCPLFPSVLVFVEWCASMLGEIEVYLYAADQKSATAISYFFYVLIELLNQLNDNRKETKKLVDSTPLWEDYELRGFVSVAFAHFSLDFSGRWEHIDNFESGAELRTQRLNEAAHKIATRSNNLLKWVTCDELGRKFDAARSQEDHEKKETENVESIDKRVKGYNPNQKTHKNEGEDGKHDTKDNPSSSSTNEKSSTLEEEEVILFRPLSRYNSAPSYAFTSSDGHMSSPKDKDDKFLLSDDCFHRTTSLLMAQNPLHDGDIVNSRINKSFKLQSNAQEGPISTGPPSLNAWVLDKGGLNTNMLQPIEELASSYLADLSINQTQKSVISSVGEVSNFLSSTTYTTPIPSAPLLPDNAVWYTDTQTSMSAPLLPENSSPISAYSDWSSTCRPLGYYDNTNFQSYSNGYPPSKWLHWYTENPTTERVNINNDMQPTHLNAPGNHENFFYHDTYRFNQLDQCGNPLFLNHYTYLKPPGPSPLQPSYPYSLGGGEHISNLLNNFQRPSPYGCGYVRNEPQPLLEYLKEKERRLQQDPTLRGPTFMGN